MKINFRKIASVVASAVMLSSTLGMAAAASYPSPFVVSGTEDAAIVYGANADISDTTAAISVQTNLNSLITTGEGEATTAGESINLATGSQKLYMNSSIDAARSVLTSAELPTILADGTASDLSGTSYDFTQSIILGDSQIVFGKSGESMDPIPMVQIGTTNTDPIYNYTLDLVKALNVTDTTNVVGTAELTMQGVSYVIGANSDYNTLYLYGSGTTLSVDEGETNSASVDNVEHTIQLKGASGTTAATIIVDGIQKSVTKGSSYKFAGDFEVYIKDVFYTTKTGTLSNVDLLLGANTLHIEDGSTVRAGADDTTISKTKAVIVNDSSGDLSSVTIMQAAEKAKGDYLSEGGSYTDRIFGGLEVQFGGLNPGLEAATREQVVIDTDGQMTATVTFTSALANKEFTLTYAIDDDMTADTTVADVRTATEDNYTIHLWEGVNISVNDLVVINSGDKGRILQLENVPAGDNTADKVSFTDIITDDAFDFTTGTNNYGSLNIDGYTYYVKTYGTENGDVNLTWGAGAGYGYEGTQTTLYPRIKLASGAWIAIVDHQNLTTGVTYSIPGEYLLSTYESGHFFDGGGNISQNFSDIGKISYVNDSSEGANVSKQMTIGGNTVTYNETWGPAILFLEEKTTVDSDGHLAAISLTHEGTNPKMPAISTTVRLSDSMSTSSALKSDTSIKQGMTVYGTLIETDTDDNNKVTLTYPGNQMEVDILITELGATVTPGGTGAGGQVLVVKDSDVSSVSTKNLIVVGGSCINTVAAKILDSDSPLCEADFTEKTEVGASEYIIKTITSPYDSDQIAMLVAGYEAADTVNAVAKLIETGADISTDVDTSQVYPIVSA